MNNNYDYGEILNLLCNKIDGGVDESWDEIKDEIEYDGCSDTLRKSMAGKYGGYAVAKYYENYFSENGTPEEIERLSQLKDDIYKERCKNQDALRQRRATLREEARFDQIIDVLKNNIDQLETPNVTYGKYSQESKTSAIAIFGDVHYGIKTDNVLNYYDTQVSKDKINNWCNKVIKYCTKDNVNTLHLALTGDFVSGLIHCGLRCQQEEDVITQSIEISEIISEQIVKLKSAVPNLKVYGVYGNHARAVAQKSENLNSENFERMIYEFIKVRTGVPVIQNGLEDYVEFKIGNKKCVLSHGDKDSFSNAKQHFCDILGYVPDMIYLGHVHHEMINDDCGTQIIVNGSIIGTDDHTLSIRKNSTSHQIMQIFYDDGDITTHKILL